MRRKRLAAAVTALAALLVLGSAATVLFAARSQEQPAAKAEITA